jgi:hypothetical protein
VNANPHCELYPLWLCPARIVCLDGVHNAQTRLHRPAGVVFMRPGIAKVHQQRIAQVLRNIAIKALDYRRTNGLIGAHHLAVVFRVEPAGEGC